MVVRPLDAPKGIIVVEGPMDALAAAGIGYLGVGLMGNTPTPATITHLVELADVFADNDRAKFLIVPDNDAPREAAMLAARLWERGVRCTIRQIVGYKDLAAMPKALRAQWFED